MFSRSMIVLLLTVTAPSALAQATDLPPGSLTDALVALFAAAITGFAAGWFHVSRIRFRIPEKTIARRARVALILDTVVFISLVIVALFVVNEELLRSWWGAGLLIALVMIFFIGGASATRVRPESTCPDTFFS